MKADPANMYTECDLGLGEGLQPGNPKQSTLLQKPCILSPDSTSTKTNTTANRSIRDQANSLKQECPCVHGNIVCKPECSLKKISCSESIRRMHTFVHWAIVEIDDLKTENGNLKQLLTSKNAVLSKFVSKDKEKKSTELQTTEMQENKQMKNELAVLKGQLESQKQAWEYCFNKAKDECTALKAIMSKLKTELRYTCGSKPNTGKHYSQIIDQLNEPDTTSAIFEGDHEKILNDQESLEKMDSITYPTVFDSCSHTMQGTESTCPYAKTIHLFIQHLQNCRFREKQQNLKADDLAISVEAYRMALERQLSESEKSIKQLIQTLVKSQMLFAAPKSSSTVPFEKQTFLKDSNTHLCNWVEATISSVLEAVQLESNTFFPPVPTTKDQLNSQSSLNSNHSAKSSIGDIRQKLSCSYDLEAPTRNYFKKWSTSSIVNGDLRQYQSKRNASSKNRRFKSPLRSKSVENLAAYDLPLVKPMPHFELLETFLLKIDELRKILVGKRVAAHISLVRSHRCKTQLQPNSDDFRCILRPRPVLVNTLV